MPSLVEIATGLYGAWRLAQLDKTALAYFDTSVEGAYKSFFAAVIVAPGFVLLLLLAYADRTVEAPLLAVVLMLGFAYVILWVLFPLIAHALLDALGMVERFRPLLVAHNWAQCLVIYGILPVAAISASGLLAGFGQLLSFLVQVFLAPAYLWYVMRTALQGHGHIAFALLIVGLFIELVVMLVVESRLGIVQP